jgi:hypothetical protein
LHFGLSAAAGADIGDDVDEVLLAVTDDLLWDFMGDF